MYKDYFEKRTGGVYFENEYGFITFHYLNETTMFIEDVYIKPEFRQQGHGFQLVKHVENIAKETNRNKVMTTVDLSLPLSRDVGVLSSFGIGMKISHVSGSFLYFIKDIT